MSTKKQSLATKRVQRRNMSRSIVASMTDTSSNSSAASAATAETDEFEKMKSLKEEQLKQSKEYVESQGRNFVTKNERWYQMMKVFDEQMQQNSIDWSIGQE